MSKSTQSTGGNGGNGENGARAHAAFEELAPELAALPAETLIKVNLYVPKVVGTVMAKLRSIRTLRPKIEEHLPKFNLARFDRLESIVLALFYAHGAHLVASRPTPPLPALTARGTKLRRILLADASTQAERGLFSEEVLADIRKGTGYQDLGEDLIALVSLYRSRWADVKPTSGVSLAELDEAEALAAPLLVAAEEREMIPENRAKAIEQRRRAFTLLIEAYDDVRRAALYLCRTLKEANEIAPSLYSGRGQSSQDGEDIDAITGGAAGDGSNAGQDPGEDDKDGEDDVAVDVDIDIDGDGDETEGELEAPPHKPPRSNEGIATNRGAGVSGGREGASGGAQKEPVAWAKVGMPGSNPFSE
jgi:hypothetical protein